MRRKQILSVLLVICLAVTLLSVVTHAAAATITAGGATESISFNIGDASCTVTAVSGTSTVDGGDITLGVGAAVKIKYSGMTDIERTVTNGGSVPCAFTFTGAGASNLTMTLKSGTISANDSFAVKVGNREYRADGAFTLTKNTEGGATANDAVITASRTVVSFGTVVVSVGDIYNVATLKINADTLTYISSGAPITDAAWYNTVTEWEQVQGKTDTWQAPLIEKYGLIVDNTAVTSVKLQDKAGDDWSWKLTPADESKAYHTLTLKNATIAGKNADAYGSDVANAVYYYGETPLVIELIGQNNLKAGTNSDSWSAAIETHGADLTIRGGGSLNAVGNKADGTGSSSHNSAGINVINGNLVIENVSITATGDDAGRASYGINSYRSIEIKGNAVVDVFAKNAIGSAFAMHADEDIIIGGNAKVTAAAESVDTNESIAIQCYSDIDIKGNSAVKASAKTQAIRALDLINIRQGDFGIRTINGGNDTTVKRGEFALSEWYDVTYFEMPYYVVDVTAENGTVSGGGTYVLGSNVTLSATANSGYRFVKWTKDGADAGTDATLSFTVTSHHNVAAVFATVTPTPTPDGPQGNTPSGPQGNTPVDPPDNTPADPPGNTTDNTPDAPPPSGGDNASGGSKPSVLPNMGDNSNVALWFVVLIVSGAGIAAMILQKNKLI